MKLLNLAQFFILLQLVIVVYGIVSPIIPNDRFAEEKQFPFYVTIYYDDDLSCGGSIIDAKWILTAARCVFTPSGTLRDPEELEVVAGIIDSDEDKEGLYLEPEKIFPHESYSVDGFEYDITLIKLKDAIMFDDTVQKIELSREEIPVGEQVTILGHGLWDESSEISDRPMFHTMVTIPDQSCEAKGVICVNSTEDNGICAAEYGSPAVYDHKQVGVTNFYSDSCDLETPNRIAKVAFYYDWIVETMKN